MNEVMNTLLSHRSICEYKEMPVEEEILDQIIRAVQAAPDRVNLQHISVIAIKDKARREKFSELCGGQEHIAQAPVFLVFCADFYRPPYNHYPEVIEMLQQGFWSGNRKQRGDKHA